MKISFDNKISFWNNKKVFVTGHTGFKGGWLSLWLTSMGAKVTGFSLRPNTSPSMFETAAIDQTIQRSEFGDIRDFAQLKLAVTKAAPEIVFHLAAQPLVRYSYQNPIETYQTNAMGTAHLLEAMRSVDAIRAAVLITTDKCYENNEKLIGYKETDPMGGYDPYSSSKGCAELIVSAYQRSFFSQDKYAEHGLAIATARAGNVIGGGDWSEDRLIPDAINAFNSKKTLKIRNPAAIRPWQHALDPLAGYLLLAQKLYEFGPEYGGSWNFGPTENDEKSVSEVIRMLASFWGSTARWEHDEAEQPHESNFLKLDCSKANLRLNWKPRWDLHTALKQTVEWHNAFNARINMNEFSLSQISQFYSG